MFLLYPLLARCATATDFPKKKSRPINDHLLNNNSIFVTVSKSKNYTNCFFAIVRRRQHALARKIRQGKLLYLKIDGNQIFWVD